MESWHSEEPSNMQSWKWIPDNENKRNVLTIRSHPCSGRPRKTSLDFQSLGFSSYVSMMFLPALRFRTLPLPPGDLAARFLAAVIRPPRLAFAIYSPLLKVLMVSIPQSLVKYLVIAERRFLRRCNHSTGKEEILLQSQ